MSGQIRRRILVRGKVQGVGYRWFVRDTARKHFLTGWVRNNTDGTVEMEAEGEIGSLDAFASMIKDGCNSAFVREVTCEEITPRKESEFAII